MYVPILAYHKVSNNFEWGINNVSIQAFESHIKFLNQNNYYSISLAQYCTGKYQLNSGQHPVIITFDDADESVFQHAFPILESHNYTATVFVISDYVGKLNSWDTNLGGIQSRHLCWDQIIKLSSEGWEIGSHTTTHRDLVCLSSKEIKNELQKSKEVITKKLDKPVNYLSYPFNRFNERIISFAQCIGYSGGCALSVNRNLRGLNSKFNIQRYGVYAIDTLYCFKRKLLNSKIEQIKQRIICFASRGTILYKRLKK